jgi:hypothetical protein
LTVVQQLESDVAEARRSRSETVRMLSPAARRDFDSSPDVLVDKRPTMRQSAPVFLAIVCLSGTGCVKKMLINGQIEGTRQASVAFDTIGDFELAYSAAANGIVQFEGMHHLAPDNEDALFLLAKAYAGYAYGFAEDDMERAEDDGDRALAEYHKRRAISAYDRAIAYGLELLGHHAKGFDEAKASEAQLKEWLAKNFTSQALAGDLFWTGYAWVARTNLLIADAEAVANLWVGVALLERSVLLDSTYEHWAGVTTLAAYHARSSTAELDEAKTLFDRALEKTGRKSLIVQFNYATKYACARADNVLYGQLLREVLQAEDPDPSQRLFNVVAKRRAQRWIEEKRTFDACSMDPAPAPSAPAEPPTSEVDDAS